MRGETCRHSLKRYWRRLERGRIKMIQKQLVVIEIWYQIKSYTEGGKWVWKVNDDVEIERQ